MISCQETMKNINENCVRDSHYDFNGKLLMESKVALS